MMTKDVTDNFIEWVNKKYGSNCKTVQDQRKEFKEETLHNIWEEYCKEVIE